MDKNILMEPISMINSLMHQSCRMEILLANLGKQAMCCVVRPLHYCVLFYECLLLYITFVFILDIIINFSKNIYTLYIECSSIGELHIHFWDV